MTDRSMLTRMVQARWLRIEEAAEYVGNVPVSFIRELLQTGEVRSIKLGKRFIIDLRDLDAYMERLKKGQTKT